ARPCGLRGRRASRSHHDPQPALGHPLSFDLWSGYRWRNDPDYGGAFPAVHLCGFALRLDDSRTGDGFRPVEPWLRIVHFLPDRVCGRPVHEPPELDAALKQLHSLWKPFGSVDIPPRITRTDQNPWVSSEQAPEARHKLAQPVRAGCPSSTHPSAVGAALPRARLPQSLSLR